MKMLVVDDDLFTETLLNKILTKEGYEITQAKEIGKGVGLGLTTALNIIKTHNGSIHCQSEPGKETAFAVQLPRNRGGF
jgi:signal transduction histidine kinase